MLGLYIHIPFCSHVCPYCDFHKMVASKKFIDSYLKALLEEMKIKKLNKYLFDTLYIGGGTPSLLDNDQLEYLLSNLNGYLNLENLQEFTIECNPEDINEEFIKNIKKYKINRISIGVQTLNPKYQKMLNRFVEYKDLKKISQLLSENNFKNYSFDLMYGFLNQNIEELKKDIDLLIDLNPTHLSIYSLLIENHTILHHLQDQGNTFVGTDDEQASLYDYIINYLPKKNYYQYETSNFSIKGYESKHNLIYWNDDKYLAIGSGATAFDGIARRKMTTKITDYINSLNKGILPIQDEEVLTIRELKEEYIAMNFRKCDGICIDDYEKKFNENIFMTFPNLQNLINKGVLVFKDKHIAIEKKYRYVANYIIVEVIS